MPYTLELSQYTIELSMYTIELSMYTIELWMYTVHILMHTIDLSMYIIKVSVEAATHSMNSTESTSKVAIVSTNDACPFLTHSDGTFTLDPSKEANELWMDDAKSSTKSGSTENAKYVLTKDHLIEPLSLHNL